VRACKGPGASSDSGRPPHRDTRTSAVDPRADYVRRAAESEVARDDARRSSNRIGNLRLLTFLTLVTALVLGDVHEGSTGSAAVGLAVVFAGAFVAEICWHRRTHRREAWHETLRALAYEGVLRIDRRWQELDEALPAGERVRETPDAAHPYAGDLDVLGVASVVRLLGPVTSEIGRAKLRGWLLESPGQAQARSRQDAVRELASRAELRTILAAHGRIGALPRPWMIEPFLAWAERTAWMGSGLLCAAQILPVLWLGLLAGSFVAGLPPLWMVPVLVQVELLRRHRRRIDADLRLVEGGLPLRAYGRQLAILEETPWSARHLLEVTDVLVRSGYLASRELRRLDRLLDTVQSRRNPVYGTLAPVLLLDVHLVAALDRWRARVGESVRSWLEALGTVEALSALATMACEHPEWCFPELAEEGPTRLRAEALGHPLLRPDVCVRNEVDVGPPGGFLLVTGSNMSGKSTLLRAIGTNVVLARAGGPVCARSMTVPDVRVRTNMRVKDSVTAGVSLFMAELLRIRDIVRAADDDEEPPVLFLLDEILHGTNTAERRIAARAVIRYLLESGAIGAVSTHDLTLADAPDLRAAAIAVHFREHVVLGKEGRTRLTFDYRLHGGLATTRNALKLLDAVGLGGLKRLYDEQGDGPRCRRQ